MSFIFVLLIQQETGQDPGAFYNWHLTERDNSSGTTTKTDDVYTD